MTDELKEIGERAASLRTKVVRLRDELAAVQAEEQEITERLASLGVPRVIGEDEEESKTTIDRIAAGLPGHRRRRPASPNASQPSVLKAGAVGAGLALGLAIIVLLAIDLSRAPSSVSPAAPPPTPVAAATPTSSQIVKDIPPPPPPSTAPSGIVTAEPSAIASAASTASTASVKPPAADAPGALNVICTPKCDAITDNNVPIAANSTVNVAAGPHKLVLSSHGSVKTMLVNVTPGQTREVRVAMNANDQPAHDYGF